MRRREFLRAAGLSLAASLWPGVVRADHVVFVPLLMSGYEVWTPEVPLREPVDLGSYWSRKSWPELREGDVFQTTGTTSNFPVVAPDGFLRLVVEHRQDPALREYYGGGHWWLSRRWFPHSIPLADGDIPASSQRVRIEIQVEPLPQEAGGSISLVANYHPDLDWRIRESHCSWHVERWA
jgi:hypothetical protein